MPTSRFLRMFNPRNLLFMFLAFHVHEGLAAPPGLSPHWYMPSDEEDGMDAENGARSTQCSSPNLLFFFALCPCGADIVPFHYDYPAEDPATALLLNNQSSVGRDNGATLPNGTLYFSFVFTCG